MHSLRIAALVAILGYSGPSALGQPDRSAEFTVIPEEVPPSPIGCNIDISHGRGVDWGPVWTSGIVPYTFDPNVDAVNQQRTRDAMDEIEAVSSVRFVPRTTESNYIYMLSSNQNSSPVGMRGGGQTVRMFNWSYKYIIVHELLHSLGTWHEQQRSDAGQYVQIHWENIPTDKRHNFQPVNGAVDVGSYDFDSVMHYGQCAFSTCCSPTCRAISVLPPYESWQGQIGQRSHLSDGDAFFLVNRYGGGEVQNITTGSQFVSITDAITAAVSGNVILSPSRRYPLEPIIDFDGKDIEIRSDAEIVRAPGSLTTLADGASFVAPAGADMNFQGQVVVPDSAATELVAGNLTISTGGDLTLGIGANLQLDVTSSNIFGDLTVGQIAQIDGSPLTTFVIEKTGALHLEEVATLTLPDGAQVDGEMAVARGATLNAAGGATVLSDGQIRLRNTADLPITLNGPAVDVVGTLDIDGQLLVEAGADSTLDASTLTSGGSSFFTIESAANMDLATTSGASLFGDVLLQAGAAMVVSGDLTLGDPVAGRTITSEKIPGTIRSPAGVGTGDMDGDGDMDIVTVALLDNSLELLESDGATPPVFTKRKLASVSGPFGMTVADVNGDGDLDVVTAANLGGTVTWHDNFFGDATGWANRVVSSTANGALDVRVADINNDTFPDIVASTLSDSSIYWYESNGANPPAWTEHLITGAALGAFDIEVGDINNDGDMDVAAALRDGGAVMWYENDGGATPSFTARTIEGAAATPVDIALADVDGDDYLDVFVAQTAGANLVLYGNSGAAQATFTPHNIDATPNGASTIAVGDLNGDGLQDVVYTTADVGAVIVLAATGAPYTYDPNPVEGVSGGASGISIEDLNEDAIPDFAIAARIENAVKTYTQRVTRTELADGAGMTAGVATLRAELVLGPLATFDPTTLVMDGGFVSAAPDAVVTVADDLTTAAGPIDHHALSNAQLTFAGVAAQIEAFSADLGAFPGPDGIDTSEISPIGTLTVQSGIVLAVVDVVSNSGADAVYVETLVIETGAQLNTNGIPVYYGSLTLDGSVDDSNFVAPLRPCGSDLTIDGVVDASDLAMLLAFWNFGAPVANITGALPVDGVDLAALLAEWGACN